MGRAMFPDLIGNETIKNNLAKDAAAGKIAHAYIIEGEPGSGRHLLARLIFASVVCSRREDPRFPVPCGTCPTCRRVLNGNSVDATVIGTEEKAGIGVDAIRSMRATLYLTPNDGDKKAYIIEQAERLTVPAQNALLLSLEEPPPYVLFFLITTHASALLETIRSRAPVIRMEQFSPKAIEETLRSGRFVNSRSFTSEALTEIAYLANGTIGQAVKLLTDREPSDNKRAIAAKLVEGLCTRQRTSELLEFVKSALPSEREAMLNLLTLSMTTVRDLLAWKKADDPSLLFYGNPEEIPTEIRRTSVKKLIYIFDLLRNAHESIARNGSISTAMTELILLRNGKK